MNSPWWERWDDLTPEQKEIILQVGSGEMSFDEGNDRLRRIRETRMRGVRDEQTSS